MNLNIDMNKKNKMIVFYSPQGGAGKTTLAINTAIFFAIFGLKTLLIDMSIYGNVVSSLRIQQKGRYGLTSVLTLLDLDKNSSDFSDFDKIIKNSIYKYDQIENLEVLVSSNPIKMEAMNEAYTRKIINSIKQLKYDIIIVDTSSELNEKNFTLLEMSDNIIIPVIQDISCGWKMLSFKEIAEKYIKNSNKIRLIVNMCTKFSGFNNMEFEKEIRYKILGHIPLFLKNYQNYINEGTLINSKRNRKAYKNFLNIAKEILDYI